MLPAEAADPPDQAETLPQVVGPSGFEELLRLTVAAGFAQGVIQKQELTEILVDTTVKGNLFRSLRLFRPVPRDNHNAELVPSCP